MSATMLPPHHLEAEQSVLGAVILADTVMSGLLLDERLLAEHFYREQHATIYRAMVQLYDAGRPIDTLTLSEHLKETGKLDEVGGPAMVDALAGAAPAAGNVREYARIVVNRAYWRARLLAGQEIIAAAHLLDERRYNAAEAALAKGDRPTTTTKTAAQLAAQARDYLEGTGPDPNAVKLPWPTLTRNLAGGPRRGDTTLIGGYTNRGKTCVVDGILEGAALASANTHVYSNEMGEQEWTLRMVASLSGVSFFRLLARDLSAEDGRLTMEALRRLHGLPIGFTQCSGWSGQEIGRHMRRHRWEVAAVDIVNRIPHEGTRGLDEISLALTNAAREAETCLFVAAHLNQARNVTEVAPPPTLRDIRESGGLANDAHNVLFLHRETVEVHEAGTNRPTGRFVMSSKGRLYFAKVRAGLLSGIDVEFNRDRMRFRELQVPV